MTDRDVYLALSVMAEELARMSQAAESFVGKAALTSAAQTLAGTAKAIYEHVLSGEEH
jgi:hypothetical protein